MHRCNCFLLLLLGGGESERLCDRVAGVCPYSRPRASDRFRATGCSANRFVSSTKQATQRECRYYFTFVISSSWRKALPIFIERCHFPPSHANSHGRKPQKNIPITHKTVVDALIRNRLHCGYYGVGLKVQTITTVIREKARTGSFSLFPMRTIATRVGVGTEEAVN